MYAIVDNNQIVQFIPDGTQFSYNGVDYPSNWIILSSPEQRAALGIVPVDYGPEANQQFYWVSQNDPVYDPVQNAVIITFTATPKDLGQCKQTAVTNINSTAYNILQPSDYMVVRSVEEGTTESPQWKAWRQTIRDQAKAAKAAVDACVDVAELAALPPIQWAPDPNQPVGGP